MKRLFMLRHGKGGSPVKGDNGEVLYFGSKPEAKAERDKRDGTVVSFGPDHDKFNSSNPHGGK
jgi:hypothetical protein